MGEHGKHRHLVSTRPKGITNHRGVWSNPGAVLLRGKPLRRRKTKKGVSVL